MTTISLYRVAAMPRFLPFARQAFRKLLPTALTVAALLVTFVAPSHAQAAGGLLAPVITYVEGTILPGLAVLGIIGCGIALFMGIRNWPVLIGVFLGCVIMSQASTIAGLFYTGGN